MFRDIAYGFVAFFIFYTITRYLLEKPEPGPDKKGRIWLHKQKSAEFDKKTRLRFHVTFLEAVVENAADTDPYPIIGVAIIFRAIGLEEDETIQFVLQNTKSTDPIGKSGSGEKSVQESVPGRGQRKIRVSLGQIQIHVGESGRRGQNDWRKK